MDDQMRADLLHFQSEKNVTTKGPLALVVQLTDALRKRVRPWDADDFLTKNQGQVAGLGGGNLKKILARYGITRTLASEGGRTSRGNIKLMREYIDFMNDASERVPIDIDGIQGFWVEQVKAYFGSQPFTLSGDMSRTVSGNFDALFKQAQRRQEANPGTQYLGTLLQHLVAAKLSIIMPADSFAIRGASVADAPLEHGGDFVINDTVIHCTTSPSNPLISKCAANLEAGARPVIITLLDRVQTALSLAVDAGLKGRVEVWDVQQFLATNINEHGLFGSAERNAQIGSIVDAYNSIVDTVESDPSLRIEFEAR